MLGATYTRLPVNHAVGSRVTASIVIAATRTRLGTAHPATITSSATVARRSRFKANAIRSVNALAPSVFLCARAVAHKRNAKANAKLEDGGLLARTRCALVATVGCLRALDQQL